MKIRGLNLPGTPWVTSACRGRPLLYLHVKYPLFLSDFTETSVLSTDFRKYPNMNFHENPSCGSRVVLCGTTDGRTDMTMQIVGLRNFANAPKNNSTEYY